MKASTKHIPCMKPAMAGVITGWKIASMMRYSVSSPAHPKPRLARVTPICVTDSSFSGLASSARAVFAPDTPSSASWRSRESRTESRATSDAAKNALTIRISASTNSRRT